MLLEALKQLALVILIVVGANAPAAWLGLVIEDEASAEVAFAPPGWVIPTAWTLLFGLLAIARARLLAAGAPLLANTTLGLVVLSATYAWTTLGLARLTGLSPLYFGLAVNLAVILWATWLATATRSVDAMTPWMFWPVVAWTTFATWLVWAELRLLHP